ncbi:hypothetical protein FUAX_37330 [Fulvitalea axinellae]|uniref:YicC family protein n=2 Tax=Fulvitalea axinellae TaxID=1182444 RepID=A0AAU9CGL2_9BACT|nr:hypothetical protein FUAX_37330 [Fulvitalea axinellae]
MTGYGKAHHEDQSVSATAEIRTLNSKFLDANIRLPKAFSDKELELRNLLSSKLVRGKVAVVIEFEKIETSAPNVAVNKALFKAYYEDFQQLAKETGADDKEIFKLALQAPDVIAPAKDNHDYSQEWELVKTAVLEAIANCDEFRMQEGQALKTKLTEYADNIGNLLEQVPEYEQERVEIVKQRLRQNLQELTEEQTDKNRFEQELIYYLEKYDISEEKVRLGNHIKYFKEVLDGKESNGKKLGFISQEMGREINTLGAKANHSGLQKIVVRMKDDLEKIKEQSLNVL